MIMAERMLESLSNKLLDLDNIIGNKSFSTDQDTYEFVNAQKNENTKKKTSSDINKFKSWIESNGDDRAIVDIPPQEMNMLLARFFMTLKKSNGSHYELDSLKAILCSINRFLKDRDYGTNLMTSVIFHHAREMLATKRKIAKSHGLGNKKNRSDPFTEEEIELLKRKGLLGTESPEALINTIWLNNMLQFGLRGRQEHVTMLWGDVELLQTSNGREYLAFTERLTKTRNGISADPRAFTQKMFSQPGDKDCPVEVYKKYAEKRPEKMRNSESAFYVAVNPNWKPDNDVNWYMNAKMGVNKLGKLAKVLAEKGNLQGKHTNHSGRTSMVTQQLKKKVAPIHVAQLSGHRNLMSLNSYHTMSLEEQIELSDNAHAIHKIETVSSATESSHTSSFSINQDMNDNELLAVSQEIEEALSTIQTFENQHSKNGVQIVDLPVVHHADGSLSVDQTGAARFDPSKLFVNCTFNAPIQVNFK